MLLECEYPIEIAHLHPNNFPYMATPPKPRLIQFILGGEGHKHPPVLRRHSVGESEMVVFISSLFSPS